ncbi:unnamed protein product [Clonostachys rosea f. rosea IK726]|uniref:Uncharacterized protein n=1 Tax=Clonostachys rosea f. rosea IK726 TaxID=1349383 RepID=A0ACA9U270_BIOOC|nr:unnamed protein product [Clonostachys rosea f. rosea IK726]
MHPRRLANEHALQHLLRDPEILRVTDKVGPELRLTRRSEWHIVSYDGMLVAFYLDRGEGLVRLLRLRRRVVELDVVKLRPSDDGFLRFGPKGLPPFHVVEVLLNDDVAASRRVRFVLLSHEGCFRGFGTDGIRRAIDKSQQVAGVEVSESDSLVIYCHSIAQTLHQLPLKLKAQVPPVSPNVEEYITCRGHGRVFCTADLLERMQLLRLGQTCQATPDRTANPNCAAESAVWVADGDVLGDVANAR